MTSQAKIFISYRRSQRACIEPVVGALKAIGIDVFYDVDSIDPLADFPQRTAQGIAESHALLAWWSIDYSESDHCLNEFKLAWQHARRYSSDVGRRVWVLNPEAGGGHISAGELAASNFLMPPVAGSEAAWAQTLLPRLRALLPEGPLADERAMQPMPPMYGMPFGNDNFTGRNPELMRIHSLMQPPRIGATKRDVAVQTHGLGGIGKTELAIQYARQFDSAYPAGIHWLNLAGFEPEHYPEGSRFEAAQAAWTSALAKTFANTPKLLLDAEGKPLAPDALHGRLTQHFGDGDYLWVLDNVPHIQPESLRDAIIEFWRAPGPNGRSLVTTRDQAPMSGFSPLPLAVLNAEDALRLLVKYRRPAGDSEHAAAQALVEKVGAHPQALTLLGHWLDIAASDQPYARALDDITSTGALPHIEAIAQLLSPQLGDKARGIVATFELSIQALYSDARELLTLAAVCAPNEAIPRGLLADAFGDGTRENACSLALGQLLRGSLLKCRTDGDAVEIHPLLSETAFHLLGVTTTDREKLDERVARTLLARTNDSDQPRQRKILADDVRQAQRLAMQSTNQTGINLGLHAARHHYANGNYTQAASIGRHAMEAACNLLGEEHPDTLTAMNNLACTLRAQGGLAGARHLQESVLAASIRLLGEEHLTTLIFMNNLASTLQAQGDLAGTRRLQESVVAASQRLLGEEHPDTLASMSNLATTLQAQGDLAGARHLQESVLAASIRLLGEEHLTTLIFMNNLANTLRAQGDLAGARSLQESVLAASQHLLGEEHPHTLAFMNNLAGTLWTQGDLTGARHLQESILAARRCRLGEEHRSTLRSAGNLAITLQAQGDLAGASHLQESVLSASIRLLGEEHQDSLSAMNYLANTFRAQGDLARACSLQENVLAACQRLHGDEHPDTLTAMRNLANTLRARGNLAEARQLSENVLAASLWLLGEEDPDTLTAMNNLAGTLKAQGDLAGACCLEEYVLTTHQRQLGEEHPDTLASMNNLATTLQAQGDLARAQRIKENVLAAHRRLLGEEHPDTLTAMKNLACTLQAQGDLAGAQRIEENVLAAHRRLLGEEHPDTLTAMNNLACTLLAQGDLAGAQRLEENVLAAHRRLLGEEHPNTIVSAWNCFCILIQLNDISGSTKLLKSHLLPLLDADTAELVLDLRSIRDQLMEFVPPLPPKPTDPSPPRKAP